MTASEIHKPNMNGSSVGAERRILFWLFLILFSSYGYFHQGGGWSQNSRLDQIRAIVETQQLEINDYWIYQALTDGSGKVRLNRLAIPEQSDSVELIRRANTWDISLFKGNIVPNKPPGTVFLALPAYFLIYHVESMLGIDPDDWWTLNLNSFLITVFSLGLLSALGGVVFFLVSKRLFPTLPTWVHCASTLSYGLGTLILPYGTLLFDHNFVAALSIFAFYFLLREGQGGFAAFRTSLSFLLSGFLCGLMVIVNYSAAITVACLMLYGLVGGRDRGKFLLATSAGLVVPLALLAWYHWVCFGSPLALANTNQVAMFRSADALAFGMFSLPKLNVVVELLFGSQRGLFFTSPVLLIALIGWYFMVVDRLQRSEAILFVTILAGFVLMNSSFNFWKAGWTFGPRYLIPAIPFIALPLAVVFNRLPRLTGALAVLSVVSMLLITAIDLQVPELKFHPLFDYIYGVARGGQLTYNGVDFDGPVSANPLGVFEGWDRPALAISAELRRWHSFNLGEFFWPGSFLSLMPLIAIITIGLFAIHRQLTRPAPSPIALALAPNNSNPSLAGQNALDSQ